jgi:membrane protease YdiL (CAAX protease family)
MNRELATPPGFWRTVALLLGAARRRSTGRTARQKQLLQNRGQARRSALGQLGVLGSILLCLVVNGMTAGLVFTGVHAAQRFSSERQGKIVLTSRLFDELRPSSSREPEEPYDSESLASEAQRIADRDQASPRLRNAIESEAKRDADRYGENQKAVQNKLWNELLQDGGARFVSEDEAEPGLAGLRGWSGLPQMIGSLMLLLWLAMMICQGEGMELDLQRRRHPMWEWLLSHPAPPGAVFLAEILMPLSANPMYWCGPFFIGILYGMTYGPALGFLAALLAGVPVTVGAACLGKALEIGIMIRLPPRSRGGVLGMMSWLGYAVLLFSFAGIYVVPRLVMVVGKLLFPLGALPWPWLLLFLGGGVGRGYNFSLGVALCWALGALMTAAGVGFSLWGIEKGLSGNYGRTDAVVRRGRAEQASFGREPLYRKELLWFLRDRSAIVQAILIPITAAGYQLFNMRGLLVKAQGEWNYLCGAAICFGTYFLWILGPKSLTSEGTALWIPLTWPRGLESLLKAKARLWAMISTALVLLIMGYTAILYPAQLWKIALVLVGWFLFARSMAEKSVTLVTVASSSGEVQKTPAGRRWATQMGILTFSIGIITQQWQLAVIGIVFSYMTAAAMWHNFRARLPFLYDPWSEQLPPPPTPMHAMVAISAMIEVTSLLTACFAAFGGQSHLGLAMLFGYGVSSVGVSLITMNFLSNRGVPPGRIWNWPPGALPTEELPGEETESRTANYAGSILWANYEEKPKFTFKPLLANLRVLIPWIGVGAAAGLLLGAIGHGYVELLHHLPVIREMLDRAQQQMARSSDVHLMYGILAVCFAPFAEEYLFRGLLYRTLDREWGGWRAVLGSAAFFTVYHPVLAWVPVFTLGVLNALLFRKSGKLLPAVALHMAYNLVVSVW